MEETLAKSINSNPDPAIVFMPQVAMQFIEFDDLGGGKFDLRYVFPKGFHPLIDGHMTKPQDSTKRLKAQIFQVQVQPHTTLVRSSRIGLVVNRKKVMARFALVELSSFDDPTFDSVRTVTPGTIQHFRHHGKVKEPA